MKEFPNDSRARRDSYPPITFGPSCPPLRTSSFPANLASNKPETTIKPEATIGRFRFDPA
ncbi:MAG: hypothetical protein COB10_06050 [Planctomycetota bacterium]|nr:MAG: hypothetical protein COB10_06050 [Planctomycetota bacterium]